MSDKSDASSNGSGRRRGRGEGAVRRRADGRWEAVLDLGWIGGKRRRRSIYGKTRAEATAKLRKAQAIIDAGGILPDERIRLSAFLDRWLAEVVRPSRELATWRGYEANVRRHINPVIGHRTLSRLTPADVQALINIKRSEGLAPRTVQYIHATLRAGLNVALRWGLVSRNVATLVEPVGVNRDAVVPFSKEEAARVLKAASDHPLAAFYTVAMAIGLRPSEGLALTWDDIDFDQGLLRVRRSIERRPEGFTFKATKSRTSRRTIPLPRVCLDALSEHRVRQAKQRETAGDAWQEWNLVFSSPLGRPLGRSEVSRQFGLLLERAGVAHRRLYDCRHTAASLLLVQGVNPRVVMEILGHSSFTLTMETYTHVLPELLWDAAAAMDRALGRDDID